MHATTQQRHLIDTRTARAFLIATAIFIAGAALGASAAVVAAPAARDQTVIVAGDRSYDAIEDARAGGLVVGDRRYDAIEDARVGAFGLGAADHRYDAIEDARGAR
ncbi:MAG TPA: hypothetical protein VFN41_03090 [Candidatus Limnocylindrales bacterium]|nr:hypothetical protein [Candidatus Limnocylindrales bacterium]